MAEVTAELVVRRVKGQINNNNKKRKIQGRERGHWNCPVFVAAGCLLL